MRRQNRSGGLRRDFPQAFDFAVSSPESRCPRRCGLRPLPAGFRKDDIMKGLEAQGVTKSFYEGAVHVDAVRGVDMAVRKGEMLSIIGRSGSGKSTLLCLLGAIDAPTTGRVLLEGK